MFNVYDSFKSNRRTKPPQSFIPQSHFMFSRTDPTRGVPFDEPPSFKPFARKLASTLGNLLLIVMLVLLATASVGKPAWAGGDAPEGDYVLVLMPPVNNGALVAGQSNIPVFWRFNGKRQCDAARIAIMFHYQDTRWDAVCVKQ